MATRNHTARPARRSPVPHIPRDSAALAFGGALRAARKAAGMTQEQLAEAAGFDRTYPSLLERGLRSPTVSVILCLAAALGIDPAQLVRDVLVRLHGRS
jgi:transcriptional regulator with XRE-family HTH domain